MRLKSTYYSQIFLVVVISIFSFGINYYYGNRGVFPQDSFLHFDSAFRILNGDDPFEDYWTVSAPFVDYLQALFFFIFGINWYSYLFHASFLNCILAITTFYTLRILKLNYYYCFLYAMLFSTLAYTSSGTPFVDHHAIFFSLLSIYSLIFAIKTDKKILWFLIPFFLGFAFFSKQVPASYIVIAVSFVIILNSIINKKYSSLVFSLFGLIVFLLLLVLFSKLRGINFSSFLDQYILYTLSIGEKRFKDLNLELGSFLNHFKFILIAILPLVYFNFKKLILERGYIKNKEFLVFLTIILLVMSFIFHQMMTKNQTLIFFLIPLLTAFSHISLQNEKFFINSITISLIIICIFGTLKYHIRFNEDRKFHEFKDTNFNKSIKAINLDQRLKGLNWISPEFSSDPEEEISLLKNIKIHLQNDNRKKMILTNYNFLSAITGQKLSSPSRGYTGDGTSHPLKGNKFEKKYLELINKLIIKNKITVIYVIGDLDDKINFHYLKLIDICQNKNLIFKEFKSYELKNCS